VETGLVAQGFKYSKISLDDYIVIYDIKNIHSNLVRISNDNISFTASIKNENAYLALDDNLDSRWASATPQKAGMSFIAKFTKPVHLKSIRYDTGHWAHDYPRGLKVELILTDGTIINICDHKSYYAIRYYLHGDSEVTFYADHRNVSEVRLIQTGEHPIFDWTIAELSFYE
jgi:hypothetical protein